MLVLCCGDRDWKDKRLPFDVLAGLKQEHSELRVIEGGQRGADFLCFCAADLLRLPVRTEKAEWGKFGKAAGPIRNRRMLDMNPDLVIGFHDDIDSSKGTRDCLKEARKRGIEVWLVTHDILYRPYTGVL